MPPEKRTPNDPVAIRQWVVAAGLVLHAEDSAFRGSSADLVTALVVADAAIEAGLGIMSARSKQPIETDSYGAHLARAAEVAKLPAGLTTELRQLRKIRNGAVHQGAEVTRGDAQRAIIAARDLLDRYVPRVLRRAKALGHGRGIADAVASLIPDHPVGLRLVQAQSALSREPRRALELCAEALDQAERHTRPPLPGHGQRSLFWRLGPDETGKAIERLRGSVDALAQWVAPLALGLSPAEYALMTSALPLTIPMMHGTYAHHWDGKPPPNSDVARRTLERIAFVVLRLWTSGLLVDPAPSNVATASSLVGERSPSA